MPPAQNEAPCPHCNGVGFIELAENRVALCICSHIRQMRTHLGPEIAAAPKIFESPLYVRGESPVDLTKENLFLKGRWRDLIPHFRFALICKGLMFRFLVITDERIKNVFVGNEHAMLKSRDERNTEDSFNSLGDVMCEHDLVLVRLGFLGHKNVAMPGALKEALMLREIANKPTWIIEEPDSPFVYGHRAYSDEVAGYINSHFKVLDLLSTDAAPPVELRGFDVPNPEVTQQQQEYLREQPQFVEEAPQGLVEDIDLMMGSDSKKRKPSHYAGKKNKSSGGGPVG